jgi:hypothetical protein
MGTVLPCTAQGIYNGVAAGGGPYTFACDGPTTVRTEPGPSTGYVLEKDVILDGEGLLTVDGDRTTQFMFTVDEGVVAELRGITVSGAGCTNGANGFPDICGFGTGITNRGALTLAKVTVSDNRNRGIFNLGTLAVVDSTVSQHFEAGIENADDAEVLIVNSTVSSNDPGLVVGENTATMIRHSTFGTIALFDRFPRPRAASLSVTNSIIASCGFLDQESVLTSGGYNIESDSDTCGFDQPTDQVDVTADALKLGPLQDNGGPTPTRALGEGSTAIDVIPQEACSETTDQRGAPRPESGGDRCDIGALEAQP